MDDAFAFEGLSALGRGRERCGSSGSGGCRRGWWPVLVVLAVLALLTVTMVGMLSGSAVAQSGGEAGSDDDAGDESSGSDGEAADTGAEFEGDGSRAPVMVSTYTLKRLEADPWSGGAWIGMETGLLYKSLPDAWDGGDDAGNDAGDGAGEGGDAGDGGDRDDREDGGLLHFGPRNGLPSPIVNSVEVTPDRVYAGTAAGLAVLDKSTGTILNVTRSSGGGVFDAHVHGIALERTEEAGDAGDGRAGDGDAGDGDAGGSGASDSVLWVGTGSEGMFRVDPATLVAEPVVNPHDGSRFDDPVMDFAFDGEEMFISVNKYGVVRWDRDSGETDRYRETARLDEPLYFRMALTSDRVWVGTSYDGAIAYDRETGESEHYSSGDTLAGMNVFQVEAFGGDVWFTTDGGVARYDRSSDSWQNYQNAETGWAWGAGRGFEMIDGTLYGMSHTNQIARYDAVEDRWERIHWWTSEEVAPWDTITSCTRFDEDRLLFTTAGRSTWLYEPSSGRWTSVAETLGDPEEGAPEILHRDAALDDRALWIASDDGLGRFDRSTETWTTHETFADHVPEMARNTVEDVDVTEDSVWAAVLSDSYGHLDDWATGHLARYDRGTGEWTRWNTTDGLSGENVTAVEPVDGRVFVGVGDGAIDVLDPRTGEIEHVYEASSEEGRGIYEFHAAAGTLWAATTDGLVGVNVTTLEIQDPPQLQDLSLASVASTEVGGGELWAGGVESGLHRWNASTGELSSYTVDSGADIWGYCVVEHDGLLYVGTQRGIDRLDPKSETFLPQYATAEHWLGRADDESRGASISIDVPGEGETVGTSGPLTVEGASSGPPGTTVQVRGAGASWTDADGTEEWSAQIPLDSAPTGTTVLSARLVDGDEVLVQTSRTIELVGGDGDGDGHGDADEARQGEGWGASSSSAPRIEHEPVLVVSQGQRAPVNVTVDPMPEGPDGIRARLVVAPPDGGDRVQTELAVADDRTLVGELPLFERPGSASYQVWLSWEDERVRLPEAGSPYGYSYPVAVRALEGIVSARLSLTGGGAEGAGGAGDEGGPLLAPGAQGTVRLSLQNTGSRAGAFELTYAGPAADWLERAPETIAVDAGTSRALTLEFSVPQDVDEAEYGLEVQAVHDGYGASRPGEVSLPVTVSEQSSLGADRTATKASSGEEPSLTPGAGLVLALASAAVAASARARRRGR